MKKLFLMLLLGFIGVGVACAVVVKQEQEKGFINVSTSAEEEYKPNIAKVTFSVQTEDKNATVASEKNKEIANQIIANLKKQINESKNEKIRTTGFSVQSEYNYQNGKKIFEKYSVQNTIEVTIKDMDKVGKIINDGIKNGATSVSNLVYSIEQNDNACDELIGTAAKAAQKRANYIAKTMGGQVVGVKEVSASCSGNEGHERYYSGMMYNKATAADSMDSAIPTEAGSIKLKANFSGQFYIAE